jgi:hypothetical protein
VLGVYGSLMPVESAGAGIVTHGSLMCVGFRSAPLEVSGLAGVAGRAFKPKKPDFARRTGVVATGLPARKSSRDSSRRGIWVAKRDVRQPIV